MQPQAPLPSNYLDQIAPVQQKSAGGNKLFLILGGILIAVVILFVMMAAANSGPKTTTDMTTLGLRLQTLQKIAQSAQKNIKDSNLQSINSNITTYLTNANRDIAAPLATNKINLAKASKKLIQQESGDDLSAKLEDARLNAVFDDTYVTEMTYQLKSLDILMKKIYKTTKSKSMKSFLETSDKNLNVLYTSLTSYKPFQSATEFTTN